MKHSMQLCNYTDKYKLRPNINLEFTSSTEALETGTEMKMDPEERNLTLRT